MAQGRPRIPTALKKAAGDGKHDSGKRIIPDDPATKAGPPPVPPEIAADAPALAAWRQFIREAPEGVITHADRAALVILAQTWATLQADTAALAHASVVVINNQPQRSPYHEAVHKNAGLVLKLCETFGMTPASRAKFAQPKPAEQPDDDFGLDK